MRKVLGADISKSKINYCLISEEGEIVEEGHVKNDCDGFETLYTKIKNHDSEVIFESTGVYSHRYQYFLEIHQVSYVRMNPLQAKKGMDDLRVTKNDVIDARQLAILQLDKRYASFVPEDDQYLELRRQHRYYQQITDDCATAKNRLHRCLQETFSEIECLFKGENYIFYKLILMVPHANMIKGKSVIEVARMIQPVYGSSLMRAQKTAKKLIDLAERTGVSVPQSSCLTEQTRHWAQEIINYQNQKVELLDSMNHIADNLTEVEILESIPGVGRAHALGLIAELGSLKRFSNSKKINAYIGIDLRFHDSGQISGNGYITKRGNAIARKILFKTVINVLAAHGRGKKTNVSDWYHRRSAHEKGSRKKILVGAMDRTIRLMHHLVISQEMFTYQG